ncbi:bifunctional DNA primase/polymerase [Methylobacterium sp. WL120]|uniref:bifunctional DNA primase/polymerase n=1 Tax=Methylobacterium sp. WL120 TaxID=2603887 RepID=UPI00164F5993|nr:bifunctional DNA primase/polymerase [Methylobacterium sp. WL120]
MASAVSDSPSFLQSPKMRALLADPRCMGATARSAGEPEPKSTAVSTFHQINAPTFEALAPLMLARGWSVFPQLRGDKRGPGLVDGTPLRWQPYGSILPSQEEMKWWCVFCPSANIAIINGIASGGLFTLDIDIGDADLSVEVQRIAERILGETPFVRIGRAPRIALGYRQAVAGTGTGSGAGIVRADDIIRSREYAFARRDGEEKLAIEVLAQGKPITAFGLHHKTGSYFIWPRERPTDFGPADLPLVTRAQLDAFLDEVNAFRPFSRKAASEASDPTWTYDPSAGLHLPSDLATPEWETTDGKVVDGREKLLFRIVQTTVRANEAAARDAAGPGRQQICAAVEAEFRARAVIDGRWASDLRTEIADKVRSSAEWHAAEQGRFARTVTIGRPRELDADGQVVHAPSVVDAEEPAIVPELAHIRGSWGRKRAKRTWLRRSDPARALQRALTDDDALRMQAALAAVHAVQAHEAAWISDLYDRAEIKRVMDARPKARRTALPAGDVRILKGDAGVGKTSSFWRALSQAVKARGRLGYPIGFSMPSHANIEDSLSGATRENLAWDATAREVAAVGEKHGLKVVVFRGKLRTNCGFKTQIQALTKAQIGTERLCKSRVQDGVKEDGKPKWKETVCPMFEACSYQRQLVDLLSADVILFASAYLSTNVPKPLSDALVGLVVDERPYSGLLATNSKEPMPLSNLDKPRAAPRLLKEEYEAAEAHADPKTAREDMRAGYLADRASAVMVMMPSLKAYGAGAAVTALHEHRIGNRRVGLDLARSAYIVCARGSDAAKDVEPGMSEQDATALAEAPRSEGIWEERRFWKIVIERLEALAHDEDCPFEPRQAMGRHDARLQVVSEDGLPHIRMSWRGEPSFGGTPLMLLDASAAPEIVEKVWAGREVSVLPVKAPCHMRVVLLTGSTFSDLSMIPSRSRRIKDITAAAARVALHRNIVTRLAGVHGNGRILVGGNKPVMRVMRTGWKAPENIDCVHNGAMRGLDFAKHHVAAILFGRLELPIRAIDALVACLTYDDPEPETPVDALGTGVDMDDEPIRPTVATKSVAMRDGADLAIEDRTYDGRWARLMQSQHREEEVRQFAARLRPVHRLGAPPVVYLATSAIPDGMIVDDVVAVEDLLGTAAVTDGRHWDVARLADGLLSVDAAWHEGMGRAASVEASLMWTRAHVEGHPEAQGLTRMRYRLDGGPWRFVSALTSAEPEATLRAHLAREDGCEISELDEVLELETLWVGNPVAPSGVRPPDALDFEITGLPVGSTREVVRLAHSDREVVEREAMIARVKAELSGLPVDADPAAIQAALEARRIPCVDWQRLLPYAGADRKMDAVDLAVRVLMAAHGADDAEDLDFLTS